MQLVEVPVASAEREIVLQNQCCNPDVIGGDWGPLTAELAIDSSVVMGGLVVGKKDVDTISDQKLVEDPLVLRGVTPDCEPSPEFAQDHKGQEDFLGGLQSFERLGVSSTEIRVPVGIQGKSHFHNSASMRSWSAIA